MYNKPWVRRKESVVTLEPKYMVFKIKRNYHLLSPAFVRTAFFHLFLQLSTTYSKFSQKILRIRIEKHARRSLCWDHTAHVEQLVEPELAPGLKYSGEGAPVSRCWPWMPNDLTWVWSRASAAWGCYSRVHTGLQQQEFCSIILRVCHGAGITDDMDTNMRHIIETRSRAG